MRFIQVKTLMHAWINLTKSYILNTIRPILQCDCCSNQKAPCHCSGDECFEVILVLLRGAVQDCRDVLLAYISTVTFPAHPVSSRYICAALNLVCKVSVRFYKKLYNKLKL